MKYGFTTAVAAIAIGAAGTAGAATCMDKMKSDMSAEAGNGKAMLADRDLRAASRDLRSAARTLQNGGFDKACQDVVSAVQTLHAEAETMAAKEAKGSSSTDAAADAGTSDDATDRDRAQDTQQSEDRDQAEGMEQSGNREQAEGTQQSGNREQAEGMQQGNREQANASDDAMQFNEAANGSGTQAGQLDTGALVLVYEAEADFSEDDLIGYNIYTPSYDYVAEIDGVIHGEDERITHLVVSYGGFWNIGDKEAALPVDLVGYSVATDTFFADITEEQLEDAPDWDYEDGEWVSDQPADENDAWYEDNDVEPVVSG